MHKKRWPRISLFRFIPYSQNEGVSAGWLNVNVIVPVFYGFPLRQKVAAD